jgi:hypothetical protein
MGYLSLWYDVSSEVVGGGSLHVWNVVVKMLTEEPQMTHTIGVGFGVGVNSPLH